MSSVEATKSILQNVGEIYVQIQPSTNLVDIEIKSQLLSFPRHISSLWVTSASPWSIQSVLLLYLSVNESDYALQQS